jgi:hypothetical protein
MAKENERMEERGNKRGGVGYKKKVRSDRVRRRIMGKEENCLTLKDNG